MYNRNAPPPPPGVLPGQDTSEVREGHVFDVGLLETYLQKHVPSLALPLTVRQFKIGQSNPTFMLQDAKGVKYVMRKKPPGKLIATAHMVEREYRVMNALKLVNFPVPKMICLCEDSSVIGTPFYVMEFLTGRIFADPSLPDLKPEERTQCWKAIIKTLAQLHQIDFKKIGLEGFGKEGDFYKRQISRMKQTSEQQVIPEKVSPLPHIDELLRWYSSNLPPEAITIVHGDYKMDNIMFKPDSFEVLAVLDWEMSTIGHPLSDLANMAVPFFQPPPISTITTVPGILSVEEIAKEYAQLTKIPYPIRGLDFTISFAVFRLAVIMQGIGARLARGQASSSFADTVAAMANPHAEIAYEIILRQINKSKI